MYVANSAANGTLRLALQLRAFRLRLLEQWQIGIRLLPQRQKVLVGPPGRSLVPGHRLGARQLQLRQMLPLYPKTGIMRPRGSSS